MSIESLLYKARVAQADLSASEGKPRGPMPYTDAELRTLMAPSPERLGVLLAGARQLTDAVFGRKRGLCAIVNARSGRCAEDCAFCAQSAHHAVSGGVPEHDFITPEKTAQAAREAVAEGAVRFGVVASGLTQTGAELDALEACVRAAVQATAGEALVDVSAGCFDEAACRRLLQAGASGFHHNLETGRAFFPTICTTHDYEEDVAAVRAAKRAGAYCCSGGVFGLGESWEDRLELAQTLAELGVDSVPINFLMPVAGTPLGDRPMLTPNEALAVVALFRFMLPWAHVRVAGGRHAIFPDASRRELFQAGASGVMVGDYLTRSGAPAAQDREDLAALGLAPEGAPGLAAEPSVQPQPSETS